MKRKKFQYLSTDKDSLKRIPEVQEIKLSIDKLNSVKLRTSA